MQHKRPSCSAQKLAPAWLRRAMLGGSLALCAWARPLAAQPAAPDAQSTRAYFKAFADRRLISVKLAEVRELRELLAQAEALEQSGHNADAALLLTEITEHPRFADYSELQEFTAAHYRLGSALWKLGAVQSAQKSLKVVLARGPEDRYFAAAFRRYVDTALSERQLKTAIDALSEYDGKQLPADARAELAYLHARARLQAGDLVEAKGAFERIPAHSRFYASAQFELGALAADSRAFADANRHFCSITRVRDDSVQALLSDARYFTVKDLARLGEGRVAHEEHHGRQAFDHYFQIPNDSQRLPEALFEAAYARYETGDPDTAIDLLDQLQARFPRSPHADEASLLRGYVALARCDFRAAEQHFERFEARFTPVVQRLDRTLKNPARREAIYQALLRESPDQTDPALLTIIGLLGEDETFQELHERVRQLDQQAASASRAPESFELLRARYLHGDKPLAAAPETAPESDEPNLEELKQTAEDARRALSVMNEQLDLMRSQGAKVSELADLEQTLSKLSAHQNKLRAALDAARLELASAPEASLPEAKDAAEQVPWDIPELLQRDAQIARSFERRAQDLRPQLIAAANHRALGQLRTLHARLSSYLRRARIGHIDAAMGEKRHLEREIESLAAGRFPPEHQTRLRKQTYLRDDEEYWPYEGEDWADEVAEPDTAGVP
ncbi:MAG TPA: tetratricopeptide repeat protein [Polyangiales bacterium]|nr:tetratricopeptide repeat protein [Polyangiales bacterium]